MRVKFRYFRDEFASVKEISDITHECFEQDGQMIPLLILCQDGNYYVGSRLSMRELESIDEIITSALVKGYVDLSTREFEYCFDEDAEDWVRVTYDKDEDVAVRSGRYYP